MTKLTATVLSVIGLSTLSGVTAAPTKVFGRAPGGIKRGLAFNEGELTKLFPKEKVSWAYNWDSFTENLAEGLEFVPLLHSDLPEHTGRWEANVEKAVKQYGAKEIFSFNEPDQCGGGGTCMTDVGKAVAAHKQWVQPMADKYPDIKIGAPAVTNGVKSDAGTIMGLPYLKAFLEGCSDCKIDFVNAHWYDAAENVEYFKKHLTEVHEATGKPVWVTEFAPTTGDKEAFLREVLPWLDEQDFIARYSYHYAAPGYLVNEASNGLSPVGEVYAST